MLNFKLFTTAVLITLSGFVLAGTGNWIPDQPYPSNEVRSVKCYEDYQKPYKVQYVVDASGEVDQNDLRNFFEYVEPSQRKKVTCNGPVCVWKKGGGFAGLDPTYFEM